MVFQLLFNSFLYYFKLTVIFSYLQNKSCLSSNSQSTLSHGMGITLLQDPWHKLTGRNLKAHLSITVHAARTGRAAS